MVDASGNVIGRCAQFAEDLLFIDFDGDAVSQVGARGIPLKYTWIAAATVAGAGLLWYAARRKARAAEANAPIEGSARRVEAKKTTARKPRSGTRTRRSSTSQA